jgi:hypothetical protein
LDKRKEIDTDSGIPQAFKDGSWIFQEEVLVRIEPTVAEQPTSNPNGFAADRQQ